jgi:hypothetical protein
VPFRFTVNETFDVGCDLVSPVSDQYESPSAFTGTLKRIPVNISEAEFHDLAALANVAWRRCKRVEEKLVDQTSRQGYQSVPTPLSKRPRRIVAGGAGGAIEAAAR